MEIGDRWVRLTLHGVSAGKRKDGESKRESEKEQKAKDEATDEMQEVGFNGHGRTPSGRAP